MKYFKKGSTMTLIILLSLFTLVGCNNGIKSNQPSDPPKPKVTTKTDKPMNSTKTTKTSEPLNSTKTDEKVKEEKNFPGVLSDDKLQALTIDERIKTVLNEFSERYNKTYGSYPKFSGRVTNGEKQNGYIVVDGQPTELYNVQLGSGMLEFSNSGILVCGYFLTGDTTADTLFNIIGDKLDYSSQGGHKFSYNENNPYWKIAEVGQINKYDGTYYSIIYRKDLDLVGPIFQRINENNKRFNNDKSLEISMNQFINLTGASRNSKGYDAQYGDGYYSVTIEDSPFSYIYRNNVIYRRGVSHPDEKIVEDVDDELTNKLKTTLSN